MRSNLAVFIYFFYCSFAHSSCLDFLKGKGDHPEWIRISVRDPAEPLIDPEYIQRLNTATYNVFAPWYEASSSDISFKEAMRKHHVAATTNDEGKAYYLGTNFRRKVGRFIEPGQYLHEKRGEKDPTGRMGKARYDWTTRLKDADAAQELTVFLTEKSQRDFNSSNEFEFTRELPRLGTSVEVRTVVNLKAHKAVHRFVMYKDAEKVLAAMGEVVNDIRKIPNGDERVLGLVAEFVYLGAVLHPFPNANFSIVMAEANWMLMRHDLRGIHHRGLDMSAFFFPFDRFQKIFSRYVGEVNPLLNWNIEFAHDSPEWKSISVRNPAQPIMDEAYLLRAHNSVEKVFAPWFLSVADENLASYETMMRTQHRVLANGLSGKEKYQGASRREENLAGGYTVRGGIFRFDSKEREHRVTFSFSTLHFIPNDLSPRIQKLFADYRARDPDPSKAEPAKATGPFFRFPKASQESYRMPRTQIETYNVFNRRFVSVQYPKHHETREMLEAMYAAMKDIRALPRNSENIPRLIHLLSEYSYLGSWAHMGVGANFSLVMSQVEFILYSWGLAGIAHTNLDFVALSRPFSEYQPRFYSDIQKANPLKVKDFSEKIHETFHALKILAHIENMGDLYFREGGLVADTLRSRRIEGFAASSDSLPQGVSIEYKAYLQGKGESAWESNGTFVGTRGQTRPLNALAIRLSGQQSGDYSIVYKVRFGQNPEWKEAKNGVLVGSEENAEPITGLRVSLVQAEH